MPGKILGIQCPKDTSVQPGLPYALRGGRGLYFFYGLAIFLEKLPWCKCLLHQFQNKIYSSWPPEGFWSFLCAILGRILRCLYSTKKNLCVPFQTLKVPFFGVRGGTRNVDFFAWKLLPAWAHQLKGFTKGFLIFKLNSKLLCKLNSNGYFWQEMFSVKSKLHLFLC